MQNQETDLGTQKRQELTHVVRKSSRKRDRLRLRLSWDTELHDGFLSCGYVTVGRHGNVASLYTWTRKRKAQNSQLPKFSAVEIALLNPKFERVADKICEELIERGYEAEVTKIPQYMSRPGSLDIYKYLTEKFGKKQASHSQSEVQSSETNYPFISTRRLDEF